MVRNNSTRHDRNFFTNQIYFKLFWCEPKCFRIYNPRLFFSTSKFFLKLFILFRCESKCGMIGAKCNKLVRNNNRPDQRDLHLYKRVWFYEVLDLVSTDCEWCETNNSSGRRWKNSWTKKRRTNVLP